MDKKSMILGVMLALGLFFIGFASQGLAEEQGLVGWWRFDKGKGDIAEDSSGNGNNGKIHGATWVEGIRGKALKFDGKNDYVDCGKDESLNITDSVTIEAWIKPEVSQKPQRIVDKRDKSGGSTYDLYIFYLSKSIRSSIGNSCTGKVTIWEEWHHIAITYDKSLAAENIKYYKDGAIVAKKNYKKDLITTASRLTIGAQSPDHSLNYLFKGIIDEVKIYDRALTEEEIREHYQEIGNVLAGKEMNQE